MQYIWRKDKHQACTRAQSISKQDTVDFHPLLTAAVLTRLSFSTASAPRSFLDTRTRPDTPSPSRRNTKLSPEGSRHKGHSGPPKNGSYQSTRAVPSSPSSLDINKSEELRKTDSRRVPGSEDDVADLTSPSTETQGLQTQHASQRRFHKAPGSTSGSDRRRGPPNFTPTSHLLLGVRSTSGEVARVRLSAAIMWCDSDSLPVAAMSSCAVGRTGVWRVATGKTGRAGAT